MKTFTVKNKASIENTSDMEVTEGIKMLSGSCPFLKLRKAIDEVSTIIKISERNPAIIGMRINFIIPIEVKPKMMQAKWAMIPITIDETMLIKRFALTFSLSKIFSLNLGSIVPRCKALVSLEPNMPVRFPLIPITPGTSTSKPGNIER